jgi:hypothetical protein
MKALIILGYIVGYAFLFAVTLWLGKWCWIRTAAAFRSVFKRQ